MERTPGKLSVRERLKATSPWVKIVIAMIACKIHTEFHVPQQIREERKAAVAKDREEQRARRNAQERTDQTSDENIQAESEKRVTRNIQVLKRRIADNHPQ